MVANNIDQMMWSIDNTNKVMFVDQIRTIEERPHENLVLVANGIMQYKWFRPNKREQEFVKKYTGKKTQGTYGSVGRQGL